MVELIYKDEVYSIIGAAMEVYNTLGPGFAEPVYQEAFGLDHLTTREDAQLLNYLKATKSPLGLLINFAAMNNLEWKRMAATRKRTDHSDGPVRYFRED